MVMMANDAFIAGCPITPEEAVILALGVIIAYKGVNDLQLKQKAFSPKGVKMKFLYLDTETT